VGVTVSSALFSRSCREVTSNSACRQGFGFCARFRNLAACEGGEVVVRLGDGFGVRLALGVLGERPVDAGAVCGTGGQVG
jgi:hypothetical protein